MEVEVPTFSHEKCVGRLVAALTVWSDTHGGCALPSGYKVRVSSRSGVMPDVQFLRSGNEPGADQGAGAGARPRRPCRRERIAPSSRRYDRVKKLNWYAQLGVPEYWLVDPEARMLERLVLREGAYVAIALSLEGEDVFRPESFEGMEDTAREAVGRSAQRRALPRTSSFGSSTHTIPSGDIETP